MSRASFCWSWINNSLSAAKIVDRLLRIRSAYTIIITAMLEYGVRVLITPEFTVGSAHFCFCLKFSVADYQSPSGVRLGAKKKYSTHTKCC